jgi:hypothetical protein
MLYTPLAALAAALLLPPLSMPPNTVLLLLPPSNCPPTADATLLYKEPLLPQFEFEPPPRATELPRFRESATKPSTCGKKSSSTNER